ncbi:Inorganic pyrophosphatase [Candidatus Clavichlamydia salmonicola]|uniref:inorganic pyrophosphatase n=1 Tax=Candidatus Clavichlamydia salmonicola TaxID=469812 RepID=UPI001890CF50|nr:inorganic pyrophosphatase [Candidatus Clavichlamydia salmonicola]MBF5050486.1 Inorganic pyrophosphatase [Candidatus Clavichlamydia salmonicola]
MTLQNRLHPWHGVHLSDNNLKTMNCYIEILTGDNIKFEIDKPSGILRVDRPQKYSNASPCLYGMLPKTYSGKQVAAFCGKKINREGISGDHDPIDVCVLSDNTIQQRDILVSIKILGGFRLIDNDEADDKLIGVVEGDPAYSQYQEIEELPEAILLRIEHYFLSYKESPANLKNNSKRKIELIGRYGRLEALEIIQLSQQDYINEVSSIKML